jgi:N-acetylmuramate 1-kinase
MSRSVGVGKSEVARGFVRHCLGDQRVSVSSPTFMIAQEYDTLRGNLIHHIDLYRLSSSDEIPVDLAAGWSYVDPIGALFTNRSQVQT